MSHLRSLSLLRRPFSTCHHRDPTLRSRGSRGNAIEIATLWYRGAGPCRRCVSSPHPRSQFLCSLIACVLSWVSLRSDRGDTLIP